jgi:hypothetical protein
MDQESDVVPRPQMALGDLYKIALETRNLEIALFWQRCNYFLVLNTALGVAYFSARSQAPVATVALLGLVVCVLWFRVAIGSKFWQERWEICLSAVERELIAKNQFPTEILFFSLPVASAQAHIRDRFSTSSTTGLYRFLGPLIARKPSVTLAMMLLVLASMVFWLILAACAFLDLGSLPPLG